MKPVLVDSHVILDVATDDPVWAEWSAGTLAKAADEVVLVVNPLIYAEVSIGFERIEELEEAMPESLFRRDNLPYEAAFLAGKVPAFKPRLGLALTLPVTKQPVRIAEVGQPFVSGLNAFIIYQV